MARRAVTPLALQSGPFVGSKAIQAGLITREQLRSPVWRREFRDIYTLAHHPDDLAARAAAAALLIPDSAAITGRAAAWLLGARLGHTSDPIEIISPHPFKPREGMRVRITDLPVSHVVARRGLPITKPERTIWELARVMPFEDAVVWGDAIAHAVGLSRRNLLVFGGGRHHRPGGAGALAALGAVDRRAESPPESLLRIRFARAGLPPATPQYHVIHDSHFVARVDLAWPDARLAVEYDGAWHAGAKQLQADRKRIRALHDAGWHVIQATAADLAAMPALIAEVGRYLRDRRP